jgi:cephalosporin-C deacetylase-like acetyl esterase
MICSKDSNAYRGVYMDCLRAVDFLCNRAEVDKSKIGVIGGSQGGGLTLVTAGLYHDKIAACAYFDPFPCDLTDFINIRQQCQTELQLFLDYYNNTCSWQDAMAVQELINTKGFAHFITCPTLFVTALFDDDCPTHVGFAAYNLIKAPKQYKIFPNDSHLAESGEYDFLRQYLKKQLGF